MLSSLEKMGHHLDSADTKLPVMFSVQGGQGSHRKGPKADKTHLGTKEAVLSIKLFAETSQ